MALERAGAGPNSPHKLNIPHHLVERASAEPAFALAAGARAEGDFLEATKRAKLIREPHLRAQSLLVIARSLISVDRPAGEILAAAHGDIQEHLRTYKLDVDSKPYDAATGERLQIGTVLFLDMAQLSPSEQILREARSNINAYSYDMDTDPGTPKDYVREKWVERRLSQIRDTSSLARLLNDQQNPLAQEVAQDMTGLIKDDQFLGRATSDDVIRTLRLLAETQIVVGDFDGLRDTQERIMQYDTRPDPKLGRYSVDGMNEQRAHQIQVLSLSGAVHSRVAEALISIDNEGINQILESGDLAAIKALTTRKLVVDLGSLINREDLAPQAKAALIEGAQIALAADQERLETQSRALEGLKNSLNS